MAEISQAFLKSLNREIDDAERDKASAVDRLKDLYASFKDAGGKPKALRIARKNIAARADDLEKVEEFDHTVSQYELWITSPTPSAIDNTTRAQAQDAHVRAA